jgi:hypothetical protein
MPTPSITRRDRDTVVVSRVFMKPVTSRQATAAIPYPTPVSEPEAEAIRALRNAPNTAPVQIAKKR